MSAPPRTTLLSFPKENNEHNTKQHRDWLVARVFIETLKWIGFIFSVYTTGNVLQGAI